MEKIISLLVTIVLALAIQNSLAESVVIIPSDAETPVIERSLDDLQLNTKMDLGDRIYTVYKADITDRIVYEISNDLISDDKSDIDSATSSFIGSVRVSVCFLVTLQSRGRTAESADRPPLTRFYRRRPVFTEKISHYKTSPEFNWFPASQSNSKCNLK